ncbi:hypothetical protein LTR86_006614 [Recurvomyces mirabilis]|nr:hypothetical protein LTR86_006614 [Recurvomyces mirabilis]
MPGQRELNNLKIDAKSPLTTGVARRNQRGHYYYRAARDRAVIYQEPIGENIAVAPQRTTGAPGSDVQPVKRPRSLTLTNVDPDGIAADMEVAPRTKAKVVVPVSPASVSDPESELGDGNASVLAAWAVETEEGA